MSKQSNKALKELKESGKELSYKLQILNIIKERDGANEYQIKARLSIKRATIQGRLSDLLDEGLIYVSGVFNDGKNSTYKHQPDPVKQVLYAKNRKYTKFLTKKKSFLKNYSDLMSLELITALTK